MGHNIYTKGLFTWARLPSWISPGLRDEKRPKILGTSSGAKFEKQSKHGEIQKKLTFRPIIASVTLKAVSLLLNGMLMMWKIRQAMQDDDIRTTRIHPVVHPGNRDDVFIWHISSLFTDISGAESVRPLIWRHRKFYKGFSNARFRKPGSYEKALIRENADCRSRFRMPLCLEVSYDLQGASKEVERGRLECPTNHFPC